MESSSTSLSAPEPAISNARRLVLFTVFCLAMFLDSFNLNALFAAIPALQEHFGLSTSEASWVISACQLTYASFLLISGRLSDVYDPKPAFVVGVFTLGIFSLGAGFVEDKIGLIILRAFCGICSALTIPSALALIVRFFPEPRAQARALGIFGGVGGIGNVLGAIISGLFVQYTSYRWVFYFVAIVAVPSAIVCLVFIPNQHAGPGQSLSQREKLRNLDMVGVTLLTGALILFIFAVTSGSSDGWGTGKVIAPLIISIFMVILFFLWEAHIPFERAAVPPRTWFLPNFAVLFGVSLLPYMWWNTAMSILYPLWQEVFGWSVIKSAVHMIPIGIAALCVCFTGPLARWVSPKWLISLGNALMLAGTILFCFAGSDASATYWRFAFPGLALGSAGAMFAYTHSNIAIFASSPPAMAGIVGAIFNCGCELGAALGLAVDTSIEAGVEQRHGGAAGFDGRRAAFYWQIAAVAAEAVAVLVFYEADARHGGARGQASARVDFVVDEEKDVSRCGTIVGGDVGGAGVGEGDGKEV